MKWILVAIVMNSPVKTDMSFETLDACLLAEQDMRRQWADVYNRAVANKAAKDALNQIRSQMVNGTCIPAK